MIKMETKGPRKEIVNDQGVVAILYFFIISIVIGNLVCYWQQLLILLSESSKTSISGYSYDNYQLHQYRKLVNKDPRLKTLSIDTVKRFCGLKIQRRRQRGDRAGKENIWLPSNHQMALTSNINNLAHLKFIGNFVIIPTHPL